MKKVFENNQSTLLRWSYYVFTGLVLYFCYLMWKLTYPYFREDYVNGFLLTKQAIQHLKIWNIALYLHISTSIFVLFIGVFQFSEYLRNRFPQIHKAIGFMYLFLVLFCTAPSGLVMGYYANGGLWAQISFMVLSVLWWLFTFKSFWAIKYRNFTAHQNYAVRSYALTLSAISLRLLVVILPHFFILHSAHMYTFISFLSWLPNLFVAECIIRSRKG